HLDKMQLKDGSVVPMDGVDGLEVPDDKDPNKTDKVKTAKVIQDIKRFALVLDAVRKSVYTQVYFAACGTDHRLEEFAKVFKTLTGKTLYFTGDPITLAAEPFPPHGSVNKVLDRDKHTFVSTPTNGLTYYAQTTVALDSKVDTFLPGSMNRIL